MTASTLIYGILHNEHLAFMARMRLAEKWDLKL